MMGQVNCICTSKSGALTQNMPKVKSLWCQSQIYWSKETNEGTFKKKIRDIIGESICINSSAFPDKN